MSLKILSKDNLSRSKIAAKVIGKYHSCQDEILSGRKVAIHGTAIRRSKDYWNYITHAAFHQLEGWPPPAALGRDGAPPWFVSREGAITVSRRYAHRLSSDFYDEFLSQLPKSVYEDPVYETYTGVIEFKRTGKRHMSFFFAEFCSLATLSARHPDGITGLIEDWKSGGRCPDLMFWSDGFKHDFHSALELLEAFRRDPQEKRFHRDVVFSGVKLDGEVVGFVCLEKLFTTDIYKTLVMALKDTEDARESRLIKIAVKRHRDSLSHETALSMDFVGNLTQGAAIMGHRVFKALRYREMDRLRRLTSEEYASLFRKVAAYPYPTFSRQEMVSPLDVVRYVLAQCGVIWRGVPHVQRGALSTGETEATSGKILPMATETLGPLFEDMFEVGAEIKVQVGGLSMAPAIHNGDVVIIRKTPARDLHPGDIIMFRNRSGAIVLHRILKHGTIRGNTAFHTKGDAQHEYDQWVSHTDVLGRVVGIEKKTPFGALRKLDLDRGRWRLANRLQAIYQRLRSKIYLSVIPRLFPSRRTTEK